MIHWYWWQVGDTLPEEFQVVRSDATAAPAAA
jgi:hypothetical protein